MLTFALGEPTAQRREQAYLIVGHHSHHGPIALGSLDRHVQPPRAYGSGGRRPGPRRARPRPRAGGRWARPHRPHRCHRSYGPARSHRPRPGPAPRHGPQSVLQLAPNLVVETGRTAEHERVDGEAASGPRRRGGVGNGQIAGGQRRGAVGEQPSPVGGDDSETNRPGALDGVGHSSDLAPPQLRVAQSEIGGQGGSRLTHEPQWGSGAEQPLHRARRQFGAGQELGDLTGPSGGPPLAVPGDLYVHDRRQYLAEGIRVGEQPGVAPADYPAVGPERVAQGVEEPGGG